MAVVATDGFGQYPAGDTGGNNAVAGKALGPIHVAAMAEIGSARHADVEVAAPEVKVNPL